MTDANDAYQAAIEAFEADPEGTTDAAFEDGTFCWGPVYGPHCCQAEARSYHYRAFLGPSGHVAGFERFEGEDWQRARVEAGKIEAYTTVGLRRLAEIEAENGAA